MWVFQGRRPRLGNPPKSGPSVAAIRAQRGSIGRPMGARDFSIFLAVLRPWPAPAQGDRRKRKAYFWKYDNRGNLNTGKRHKMKTVQSDNNDYFIFHFIWVSFISLSISLLAIFRFPRLSVFPELRHASSPTPFSAMGGGRIMGDSYPRLGCAMGSPGRWMGGPRAPQDLLRKS